MKKTSILAIGLALAISLVSVVGAHAWGRGGGWGNNSNWAGCNRNYNAQNYYGRNVNCPVWGNGYGYNSQGYGQGRWQNYRNQQQPPSQAAPQADQAPEDWDNSNR